MVGRGDGPFWVFFRSKCGGFQGFMVGIQHRIGQIKTVPRKSLSSSMNVNLDNIIVDFDINFSTTFSIFRGS